MDANTFINLGGIGLLAWMVKAVYETRGDVRVIKAKLGLNGQGPGLVQEVAHLRTAKHEHATQITELLGDVQELKSRP